MIGIDRRAVDELTRRERADFDRRTMRSAALCRRAAAHLPGSVPMSWMRGLYRTPPIYVERGEGATFHDLDGNAYLDFNVCDLSMTLGFGPAAITEAVARRMADGAHFLLPGEDAVIVAEHLADLVGLPFWQFTLSASGANAEVLRVARHHTGRSKIIVFGGHYHGHLEETLVEPVDGKSKVMLAGLRSGAADETVILPFNDLAALEQRLSAGDIALVLMEPALSNCNIVLPDPGYLAGVAAACRRHGTLWCIDEAHTFQFAHGGLTRSLGLEPDFVVLGKGLGSGVPFALYGMSDAMGRFFDAHLDHDVGQKGIATGGTTYGTAVAAAAARAALEHYWTPSGCARIEALGSRLAQGLQRSFESHRLPWRAFHIGPRSGYCLMPTLPRNGAEAQASLDYGLIDARRVFMANRGIWDAVASAGPQASFAHTEDDIDRYLQAAGEFLDAVTRGS